MVSNPMGIPADCLQRIFEANKLWNTSGSFSTRAPSAPDKNAHLGRGHGLGPFIGSGTTAEQCKRLGRNYIGFDISEKYVDYTNKRIAHIITEEGLFRHEENPDQQEEICASDSGI